MSMDRSEVEEAQDEQRRRNEGISRGSPTYTRTQPEANPRGAYRCPEKGCSFAASWRGDGAAAHIEVAAHQERHRIEALPLSVWKCTECSDTIKFHGKIEDGHNSWLGLAVMHHKIVHEIEAESELASES